MNTGTDALNLERLPRREQVCKVPKALDGEEGLVLVDATWGTIQPMTLALGVHTIGELELIAHRLRHRARRAYRYTVRVSAGGKRIERPRVTDLDETAGSTDAAWWVGGGMNGGQASWTARRVAAQRLHFERVPAVYGRPDDDQRLLCDVAAGIEVGDAPLRRYLQVRTAFVDRAVVAAVDAGMRQAVLVGAGYDGRALRYARDGLSWFEVDHPDTQQDKRARLDRLGVSSEHVTFVPIDLGQEDVAATLSRAGHDADVATLFVCEGITPYLSTDVVTGLLSGLAERAAGGSMLVLEIALIPRNDEARMRRERLDASVTERGEPLRSAVTVEDLDRMLNPCGWIVRRAADPVGEPLATSARSSAFVVASRATA